MTDSSTMGNDLVEQSSPSGGDANVRLDAESGTESILPRPGALLITARVLQLKCPRCGSGALFKTFLTMNVCCSHCHLTFHREPGYYLGAIYINYGMTSLVVTSSYILCRLVLQIPATTLLLPLLLFCICFPLLISRHARALWLGMDCRFDPSVLEEVSTQASPPSLPDGNQT